MRSSYSSPAAAAFGGFRDSLGLPSVALAASYVGFGSLCRESGLSLWLGMASTATGWALPGQLALVELYAAGASVLVIALAVALTNARLLPMTVTLMPLLRHPGTARWRYYLAAHFVAVTGWAIAMQRCPGLPAEQRLPFFLGFTVTLWSVTLAATAAGFLIADALPDSLSLELVFLNPLCFMLIFAADLGVRPRALALGFGALAGPLLHLLSPDWGLLLTGLVAGTAAFLVDRAWERRHG